MDKARILEHAYSFGADSVNLANRDGDGAALVNSVYEAMVSTLLREIKDIEAG